MKTIYVCTNLGPEVEPFYCDSLAQAVDHWLDSWACIGYEDPAELYDDLTRHCPCGVIACEIDDAKLDAARDCFAAILVNAAAAYNTIVGLPVSVESAQRWAKRSVDEWITLLGGLKVLASKTTTTLYSADELFPIMLAHYSLPRPS